MDERRDLHPSSPNTPEGYLKARQKSEVAIIVDIGLIKGTHCWEFYTTSQGGYTKWDSRWFRTKDACTKAAQRAGFTVRESTYGRK